MLTDYTTYEDVRSALGVSTDELEDTALALETWDNHLRFELEDIGKTLPDAYATVKAVPEASRTDEQARLYRATRLFATLAVANALAAALPMLAPKSLTDGKAAVSRFSDAPYKETVMRVKEQYNVAQNRLRQAWAASNASSFTSTPRTYLGVANPTTDPVTG